MKDAFSDGFASVSFQENDSLRIIQNHDGTVTFEIPTKPMPEDFYDDVDKILAKMGLKGKDSAELSDEFRELIFDRQVMKVIKESMK